MIPALMAFFCLSLFALLGTHARTLPEDIFKISNTYNIRWISIFEKPLTPPPPKVAPPHRPVTSISNAATGIPCDIITRRPKAPPPPPHEWNSIFEINERTPADRSHPFPQAAPKHQGEELMSSNYVTTGRPHEEITMRPESLALPVLLILLLLHLRIYRQVPIVHWRFVQQSIAAI